MKIRNGIDNRFSNLLKIIALAPLLAVIAGCGPDNDRWISESRPVVVTSFTLIEDFTKQVGGSLVAVRVLAPVGAEVHEWELSPRNFIDLERADLVFINGLGLEQWLPQIEATLPEGVRMVPLAEETGRETIPIALGDLKGAPDPHMWMDPRAVAGYIEVIRDRLIEIDPTNESDYRDNAEAFLEELELLDAELNERFATIPETQRVLVTSEAAFLYFADAYGFRNEGIWGSNAEEEGTPRQIARIIDLIEEERPAAIFWESTITDRYVRSVADETGVPIVGPLYVDSLGRPGSGAESYLDMMRTNARVIADALTPEDT